jgi:hypothetical protein
MQGVLATQFEGVFYTVHCDFDVVVQDQRLGGDEVQVVAGAVVIIGYNCVD